MSQVETNQSSIIYGYPQLPENFVVGRLKSFKLGLLDQSSHGLFVRVRRDRDSSKRRVQPYPHFFSIEANDEHPVILRIDTRGLPEGTLKIQLSGCDQHYDKTHIRWFSPTITVGSGVRDENRLLPLNWGNALVPLVSPYREVPRIVIPPLSSLMSSAVERRPPTPITIPASVSVAPAEAPAEASAEVSEAPAEAPADSVESIALAAFPVVRIPIECRVPIERRSEPVDGTDLPSLSPSPAQEIPSPQPFPSPFTPELEELKIYIPPDESFGISIEGSPSEMAHQPDAWAGLQVGFKRRYPY